MNETINAKGEVVIQVFRNEELIEETRESNLVVTLGKTNISLLLGGSSSGSPITQIGVGSNGIAAAVTDTALTGAFTKAIDSVSYPDPQSVMYNFSINNDEANGISILEFGLLNTSNVLCARKVRDTSIDKSDVIRLVGTWKITIN